MVHTRRSTDMKKNKVIKLNGQQGDVLMRKLTSMPEGERKVLSKGRCVVAHGESGHSHVIEDDEAELIQIGERMILSITKPLDLKHEEHGAQTYSPGIWEIGGVQEYDYLSQMARRVQD